ncbi:MAG: GNAT family N-acetyltransferase [Propionicimonas sp.]
MTDLDQNRPDHDNARGAASARGGSATSMPADTDDRAAGATLLVVRALPGGDLQAAKRLTTEYVRTWYPPGERPSQADQEFLRDFTERVTRPHGTAWVAYLGETPAGTVLLAHLPRTDELLKLYVRPEFRRLGVATKLIRVANASSDRSGHDCHLVVQRERGTTLHLYQALGFRETRGANPDDEYASMVRAARM